MGVYDAITSPSSFYSGTVLTPSFLNSVKADINNLIANNWKYEVVRDHFTGSAISTAIWQATSGSPTLVDDSSNGGHGALVINGSSTQYVRSQALALGTSDFRFRMRMRNLSIAAGSSIKVGPFLGGGSGVAFYIDGTGSTTNFYVYVDGTSPAVNGTAATISASYKDFEIVRASNVVTFYVDGVALHTISSYTTNLNGVYVNLDSATSGIARVDAVQMITGIS